MNTREIAQATGKNERTVQRWTVRASDRMSSIADKMSASSPAKPADYSFDETLAIIEAGMGKNAAAIWRTNASASKAAHIPAVPAGSVLTEKDIHLISAVVSMTVSETMKRLDERVTKIESRVEERQALLPAPSISPRDHINMVVRSYAKSHSFTFQEVFGKLYREFSYRTNSNPTVSAKNRGMAIIDYIEAEGQIETLEAIAMEVFG